MPVDILINYIMKEIPALQNQSFNNPNLNIKKNKNIFIIILFGTGEISIQKPKPFNIKNVLVSTEKK